MWPDWSWCWTMLTAAILSRARTADPMKSLVFTASHSLTSSSASCSSSVATLWQASATTRQRSARCLFCSIGYVIAGLGMARLVKPQLARMQMLGALAGIVAICVAMANSHRLVIQALYALFLFAVSMFFNSFQIFHVGNVEHDARPLSVTAGHFTFAWSIGWAWPVLLIFLRQRYHGLRATISPKVRGILLLRFSQPNRRISCLQRPLTFQPGPLGNRDTRRSCR